MAWWCHMASGNFVLISSANGLLPVWRKAITWTNFDSLISWTNSDLLAIGPWETNFSILSYDDFDSRNCVWKCRLQVLAISALTFQLHADVEALLKAAIWAPLPLGLIYATIPVIHTGVHFFVLYSPFEKTCKKEYWRVKWLLQSRMGVQRHKMYFISKIYISKNTDIFHFLSIKIAHELF